METRAINEHLRLVKKTKTINELLKLVKDELETGRINEIECRYSGLCAVVSHMCIDSVTNYIETQLLIEYFRKNLPEERNINNFCWIPHLIAPRVEWLERHIELTEEMK